MKIVHTPPAENVFIKSTNIHCLKPFFDFDVVLEPNPFCENESRISYVKTRAESVV